MPSLQPEELPPPPNVSLRAAASSGIDVAASSTVLPVIAAAVTNATRAFNGTAEHPSDTVVRGLIAAVSDSVADTVSNSIGDYERVLTTGDPGTVDYLLLQLFLVIGQGILLIFIAFGTLAFTHYYPPSTDYGASRPSCCEPPPVSDPSEKRGSCCCLIPALLEHEAPNIVETVRRALAVPELSLVVLTYNTRGGDLSSVLKELEALKAPDGRFVILHNATATSKSVNLNNAMPLTEPHELCLILDADHHVDSDAVRRLTGALHAAPSTTVCIQGSVLVRGSTCWERAICTLNWYFFAVLFPAFQMICGSATFSGAGAVWRSKTLRDFQFIDGMICEDDELSMRVIRAGYNIWLAPRAEVTELAPSTICSFFQQRLRWTYGYEESVNKHLCGLLIDRPRAAIQRLYVYAWFLFAIASFTSIILYLTMRPTIQIDLLTGPLPTTAMVVPSSLVLVAIFVVMAHNDWKRGLQTLFLLPVSGVYGNCQGWLVIWARLRMHTVGLPWRATTRKTSTDAPAAAPAAAS